MAPKRQKTEKKFWDGECTNLYLQRPNIQAIPQTWYHFELLYIHGFEIICDMLKFQGWYFFCSHLFCALMGGFDIDMVRQFYANLRPSVDKLQLESIANGKTIRFSPDELNGFIGSLTETDNLTLGDETTGLRLDYTDTDGSYPNFNLHTDVAPLLANDFQHITKPTTSHLKVHNRLLVHIIYNCILPRKGSHTYLSNLVLALLHYLNNNIKVHLSALIMCHMLHVKNNSKHTLPHAAFITYYLHQHWHIKPQNNLDSTHTIYDNVSLSKMFIFDTNTSCWKLKSHSSREHESTATDPSSSHHTLPSSSAQTSQTSTDPSLNTFMQDIMTKLDRLCLHQPPSRDQFNSVSEQMMAMIRSHQETTTSALRRIEEKVDKFEDQMKGFGHYCLECMRSLQKSQEREGATQEKIYINQIALHQKFMETFMENR